MKLRNKKTGEIVIFVGTDVRDGRLFFRLEDENGVFKREINSLAKLNEMYEDVPEETKDNNYWYIDDLGRIQFSSVVLDEIEGSPNNWLSRKLFGNYFETREEAEKAVEKLKAWKRLKDKGLIFCGTYGRKGENIINFEFGDRPLSQVEADEAEKDLDLLFGGVE